MKNSILFLFFLNLIILASCRTSQNSQEKDLVTVGKNARVHYVYFEKGTIFIRKCEDLTILQNKNAVENECPHKNQNQVDFTLDYFQKKLLKAMLEPSPDFKKFLSEAAEADRVEYKKIYNEAVAQTNTAYGMSIDTQIVLQSSIRAEKRDLEERAKRIQAFIDRYGTSASGTYADELKTLNEQIQQKELAIKKSDESLADLKAKIEKKDRLLGLPLNVTTWIQEGSVNNFANPFLSTFIEWMYAEAKALPLFFIGVYEGGSQVTINRKGKLALALLSYESVNWQIKVSPETEVMKIYVSSHDKSQVSGDVNADLFFFSHETTYAGYGFDPKSLDYDNIVKYFTNRSGLEEAGRQGNYKGTGGFTID